MHNGLANFIKAMPKVELHVHLEGAMQPETLLQLARKNKVTLPADDVEGIRQWYTFTDFPHFVEIYYTIAECIRTPDDIEFMVRAFLQEQAAQNVRYTEAIYTPYMHFIQKRLPFADQLAAINRARDWAEAELNVRMGLILDIDRMTSPEDGLVVADWAIKHFGDGVIALGLGGPEVGHPPEKHIPAFDRVHAAGVPAVPHAGETEGPASIWGALNHLHPVRIEHGVRCFEDPALVKELRDRQIPLDVAPTSNICLKVFDSFENHALPQMLEQGLYVTLNSDDPPMFNTTLTDDYLKSASTFGLDVGTIEQLVFNGVRASLLPATEKANMERDFYAEFGRLRQEYLA